MAVLRRILRTPEAAPYVGLAPATLEKMRVTGDGPRFIRLGGKAIGYDMAKSAAQKVYEQTGVGPEDVDVVELHDCFTTNEVISYEALGLCGEGEAEKWIWDGQNTYGGQVDMADSIRTALLNYPKPVMVFILGMNTG